MDKKEVEAVGAASYCKTSGATGLHIQVPMGGKYIYEQVKDFAELLCMLVHKQLPAFTSLDRNLQKRGEYRIYLNYLQNRSCRCWRKALRWNAVWQSFPD